VNPHTGWARKAIRAVAGGAVFATCLLLVSVAHAADVAGPPADEAGPKTRDWNLWPLYDERDDPVEGMHVRSGLGPLLTFSRSPDSTVKTASFRPFFHWRKDTAPDRLEWEFLYPVMSYSRVEEDSKFQFLQILNFRHEGTDPNARERRFDLFPFYLSGTTEAGEEYRAVFPFYGRALNRMFFDEVEFVLFPLYARFVRLGVETRWFPWPILSVTRGEGVSGFRIIPLYGQEVKEGVYEKQFALWPLFLHQRTGLDGENPEETLAILPFYVSQRSKNRDSTTILWPLFTYTEDRERQFEQWEIAWPLIVIARGEGRTINRFLPLYSVEERRVRDQFFLREMTRNILVVLFPLYIRTEEEFPGSRTIRDRILWWLYSDTRQEGREGSARRIDAWPFFRYTRDREGAVEFQTLALLEAFMPGNEKIERNYSPLWALYTYRRNAAGDEVRSFLWNLVRHEETGAGRSIEILGPVVAYRERGEDAWFSFLGGVFEYEVKHGIRSVRFFRNLELTWSPVPQAVAVLDPAGDIR
jgi:hypothetical protein